MKIINQLEYVNLVYPTTLTPDAPFCPPYPTVAQAGCGICCACMLVERLTEEILTVEEGIALSIEAGANRNGTDMKKLGAALAKKYQLQFSWSDTLSDLLCSLSKKGAAVLNVGGDAQGRVGTFSQHGHYVLAFAKNGDRIQIADPSYTREKYLHPDRAARVICMQDHTLEVPKEELCLLR